MFLMSRALKFFAVLVLVAVLPLRAVASVTTGFCASGHKDIAAAHASGQRYQSDAHAPIQPVKATCNICAEHCSSAAFAIPAEPAVDAWVGGQDRTVLAEHGSALHVPDRLDRPPLA